MSAPGGEPAFPVAGYNARGLTKRQYYGIEILKAIVAADRGRRLRDAVEAGRRSMVREALIYADLFVEMEQQS